MAKIKNELLHLVFRFIYYVTFFFVFVGEFSRKVFWLLLRLFFFLIINLTRQLKKTLNIFLTLLLWLKKALKKNLLLKFKKCYTPLKIKKDSQPLLFVEKIKYFFLGCLFTLMISFLLQTYQMIKNLPSPKNLGKVNYRLSTHIYDRKGRILYEIFKEENRTKISLKEVPKELVQATIAIEDKDFYRHRGVNLFGGILRAIKENLKSDNQLQGGSTITQQLVKTALLSPERTIERKIREIILAFWTERVYTKDQILEMYLNQVAYGGSAYGVEEAAKTYFGKSAKNLSLAEAALLAGLPQAPSLYSPHVNPRKAIERRNQVLEAMYQEGYIDKETKIAAQKEELRVIPLKNEILAPHFVFYVKSQLEDFFGTRLVEEGGLRVTTTLDLEIQRQAEKILKEEIEKNTHLNLTNGAILVTRPATGEILAMVGSVDYFKQPWGAFNVTTALRQPGSAIKPLLYSLALENGYTPATIIDDTPTIFYIPGSPPYRPVNYDGRFHGKVPLRYALANSYNIPAVKVLEKIGVDNFIDYAENLGISTWKERNRYGLSLALGGGEVTMVDMAEAFGVLANLSYHVKLNSYLKIEDSDGRVLKEIKPIRTKKINPGVAYIISDILSDNQARIWAFGENSALEIPGYKVAVKTGTTDNKKDNWTIGYTKDFLVVVWVGNNDGSAMNQYLASGITGAAPIWNRMMSFLLNNYQEGDHWFRQPPENVVEKNCFFGRREYFIKGTETNVLCSFPRPTQLPTPTPVNLVSD